MENIKPEILALAQKIEEKRAKKEAEMRVTLAQKYNHALIETLSFDPEAKKWECAIRCTKCGNEDRHVYTSDLFQISTCEACSEAAKASAKALKKAALKEALALLKNKK